jgi:hypothetical protein
MRLDNDLVRLMLLQVETDAGIKTPYLIENFCLDNFPDYDAKQTLYHMKYLIDAHYVEANKTFVLDITPTGREFLDNVRNERIWSDTKKKVSPLGTVALNILSEVGAYLIKKALNLL